MKISKKKHPRGDISQNIFTHLSRKFHSLLTWSANKSESWKKKFQLWVFFLPSTEHFHIAHFTQRQVNTRNAPFRLLTNESDRMLSGLLWLPSSRTRMCSCYNLVSLSPVHSESSALCAFRKGFSYMFLIHFIMFLSSHASRFTVRAFRKWLRRCFARRCEHFRREKRSIIAQERSEIKTKVEKKLKPKGGKSKKGGKEACRNGKTRSFRRGGREVCENNTFSCLFSIFFSVSLRAFPK